MQALERLGQLWRRERDAARAAHRRSANSSTSAERVARGLALARLTLDDTDASAGGRVLLWWKVDPKVVLAETRIGTGDPVLLWAGEPERRAHRAGRGRAHPAEPHRDRGRRRLSPSSSSRKR